MGHPDFQDPAVWRGPVTFGQAITVTTVSTTVVDTEVTNFASVVITATPPTNGVTITCAFYTDSTKALLASFQSWTLSAGARLEVIVPSMANFLEVRVTTAQAGNQNLSLVVLPTNLGVSRIAYPRTGNSTSALNQSIALSSSQAFVLPQVIEGEGYLYANPLDASAKLNLTVRHLAQDGTALSKIAQVTGLAAAQDLEFLTSTNPVDVLVTNTDGAAAHSLELRCQVQSR